MFCVGFVLKVMDMQISFFYSASVFNQPIGSWETSKVTDMHNIFNYSTSFNQPILDTSQVTNMAVMFQFASLLKLGNFSDDCILLEISLLWALP